MKQKLITLIPAGATFIALLTFVILFRPPALKAIPLFISIAVYFLKANVNRYAFLIGGLNSLIYTASYILLGLYGMAIGAFLSSCPVQIIAFLNWRKNTEHEKTALRTFSPKSFLILMSTLIGSFAALYFILRAFGSEYILLDNAMTVIGAAANILCMLRFREYPIIALISTTISLVTYSVMLKTDPSMILWVVFTAYSLYSLLIALARHYRTELSAFFGQMPKKNL